MSITDDLVTLRDYLRWAATEFEKAELCYAQGIDNAWDEAVALMCFLLHLPIDIGDHILDAALTQQERSDFVALCLARIDERIPSAYLTKQAWFAGLLFYVDERVLIPRSPIAELIEQRFQPWLPASRLVQRLLDVGTGSACIACAMAHYFPEAEVDAVDISPEALAVAKINVERLGLADQVHLLRSDLCSELTGQQYDVIVSNPPYVDAATMAALPEELKHEPRLGLASGEDGLEVPMRLLKQAADYLNDDGLLILEVGNSAAALQERLPEVPFIWHAFERGGEGVLILDADQLKSIPKQKINRVE